MTNSISSFPATVFNLHMMPNNGDVDIHQLPLENLFLDLLKYLEPKDIGATRQTCKRFYQILQNDFIWEKLFNAHFPEKKRHRADSYQLEEVWAHFFDQESAVLGRFLTPQVKAYSF